MKPEKTEIHRRLKIGIIGCGNMGISFVQGLVEKSVYPQQIYAYDTDSKRISALKKDVNFRAAKSSRQIASISDVIILAVKPQMIDAVLDEIGLATPKTAVIISIAAGVPLKRIEKSFKERVAVVRVMPNMPAQVREGMSAYCPGRNVAQGQIKVVEAILKAIGDVVQVKESAMDLVTAISGSGPAYFFLLSEKMIEAACELGLTARVAKRLVYQTALGSAKAMNSRDEDPDVLINRVASKGGTTEAALKIFRKKGFGKVVYEAVQAASQRSRALSR